MKGAWDGHSLLGQLYPIRLAPRACRLLQRPRHSSRKQWVRRPMEIDRNENRCQRRQALMLHITRELAEIFNYSRRAKEITSGKVPFENTIKRQVYQLTVVQRILIGELYIASERAIPKSHAVEKAIEDKVTGGVKFEHDRPLERGRGIVV